MTAPVVKTTLEAIRAASPCAKSYKKLVKHLGPKHGMDAPVSLNTILASNGEADMRWVLRNVVLPKLTKQQCVQFAYSCAGEFYKKQLKEGCASKEAFNCLMLVKKWLKDAKSVTDQQLLNAANAVFLRGTYIYATLACSSTVNAASCAAWLPDKITTKKQLAILARIASPKA